MTMHIDRIQIVAADAGAVAARFHRLLGAEPCREDRLAPLSARRSVLALGESEIEILSPEGAGEAADFLTATGGGLYAAGIAVAAPGALAERLRAQGVEPVAAGAQLLLSPEALGIPGLRLVVSPAAERRPIGLARYVYEVTLLVADAAAATDRFARILGLDPTAFVPIRSAEFGYAGTLTLFSPGRLDRIEIIHPFDAAKTMGRFFARRGPSLYMAYVESDATRAIRARAAEAAPQDFTAPRESAAAPPDNLFLHPRALGGTMLGVSRTTFAWTWSGRPDRVRPAPPTS